MMFKKQEKETIRNPLEGLIDEGAEIKTQVKITRIIYSKETEVGSDWRYTVFTAHSKEYGKLMFCGTINNIYENGTFNICGIWTKNQKYGFQVKITSCEEDIPTDVDGILLFLKGKMIKGLGGKIAEYVVNAFKEDTLEIIDKHPERLLGIHGIGEKRMNMIVESWRINKNIRDIMVFLRKHNITEAAAMKLYKQYGPKTIQTVKNNPYCIVNDIQGIGFKKADEIALHMGYKRDGYYRVCNGILYVLKSESNFGNCYVSESTLINKTKQLLCLSSEEIEVHMPQIEEENHIVCFFDTETKVSSVASKRLYNAEENIATKIGRLIYYPRRITIDADKEIKRILKDAKKRGIEYDQGQLEAIRGSFLNKFTVITGGPGTGKTTIMKAIIEAYEKNGASVELAAPTGRAAKQMQIATGHKASTIHRLLGLQPEERFANKYVEADVLIIDESSMINVELASTLLNAVDNETTLIMVGDIDQLPAIGAGNVFKDLIESGVIECRKLTKIFRQAERSLIIENAHRINNGKFPETTNKLEDDYVRTYADSDAEIVEKIVFIATKLIPKKFEVEQKSIQILCPQKKGPIGTIELNIAIHNALNGNNKRICNNAQGGFYVGDRVMQIANDYDKNVFNGDIGYIISYNEEEQSVVVDFDEREVEYDINEMSDLMLAFAITVHKSQGNEFERVIMPLSMSNYMMLQRNLLYTAVTRAKKLFIAVGDEDAELHAVVTNSQEVKNTRLKRLLRDQLEA